MKGFLINVYGRAVLLNTGIFYPTAVKYRGNNHTDPPPTSPFCYGDHPENKTGLKSVEIGDVLIFHTTLTTIHETQRYFVGGIRIGKINLVKNLSSEIKSRYSMNPHIHYEDEDATFYYDCKSIFPAKYRSSPRLLYLRPPLLFSKQVAYDLDLQIQWKEKHTPYQQIAWATRAVRKITEEKVKHLQLMVRRTHEKEGKG